MSLSTINARRIKAELQVKYGSLAQFEREKDLPAESVSDVLRGKPISRTAAAIADALGIDIASISSSRKRDSKSELTDNKSGNPDLHPENAGAR